MTTSVEQRWVDVELDVKDFSESMLSKLWHHRSKGYWMDVPEEGPDYYLHRMKQEVQELELALATETTDDIVRECADVSNFAMMIAMKVQELDSYKERVI